MQRLNQECYPGFFAVIQSESYVELIAVLEVVLSEATKINAHWRKVLDNYGFLTSVIPDFIETIEEYLFAIVPPAFI